MRVLQIMGRSSDAIHQHVDSLNTILKRNKITSSIIAPVGAMNGLCKEDYCYPIPRLSKPHSLYSCSKEVKKLINDFEVLHAHGIIAALIALRARKLAKSKIPVVMTLHNFAVQRIDGYKFFIKYRIESIILKKVDYIICPSEYAESYARKFTNNRIDITTILPVGKTILKKDIISANNIRDLTRDHFYIKHDDPLCISLSRYTRQKDFTTLIRSFKLVVEKIPNAKLIIAGHSTYKSTVKYQELLKKIKLENSIHLYGNINNPDNLLAASDLFVLASIFETVPLVLIDALKFGKPVVMTKVGVAKKILDGTNGISVPILDPQSLSKALIDWLNKIKEGKVDPKLIEKSIEKTTDLKYTIEPIIEIYNALSQTN